ncbi:hypothetical protein [Sorangium sp. So ce542]|uniref:hypothetical protein n=1 Tax=Sorangium sp. So ce542 TaxID=3133316 RepID=UPI003F6206C4
MPKLSRRVLDLRKGGFEQRIMRVGLHRSGDTMPHARAADTLFGDELLRIH